LENIQKQGKARAIPGQNLALGALGVFILWFGWFGFNPGSQLAASRFRKCFCHLPHISSPPTWQLPLVP
jgi:ammonia channel protein AmtB